MLFVLKFSEQDLKFLFGSARSMKFLFNEILFLDLLDRFLIFDQKKFILNQRLILRFIVKLPFSNTLSKFKNKVYLLLYFLIFEYLVGQSPTIVPVYTQKVLTAVDTKKKVTKFLLTSEISKNFFFNFLFFLIIFVSMSTYPKLVAPSRHISMVFEEKLQLSFCTLCFKNGLSCFFEFLGVFDELILSKVKLTVLYKTVNLNSFKIITPFVFQALNFNIKDSTIFTNKSNNNVVVKRLPFRNFM